MLKLKNVLQMVIVYFDSILVPVNNWRNALHMMNVNIEAWKELSKEQKKDQPEKGC